MPVQLLSLSSPVEVSETQNSVFVKGFASVQIPDRDGEVVDPLEFDIPTFMASPTLLENHKFRLDQYRNETSVGRVISAEPCFIEKTFDEDFDYWVISSLIDGREVNTLLKNKVPRLDVGARGLFVVAEVTHPTTIRKVLRGELGGFSWFGYAHSWEEREGYRNIGMIDLIEISLVNIPANNQSTFMIGKSLSTGTSYIENPKSDVGVYQIRFLKSKYSQDFVRDYIKNRKMKFLRLHETDSHYFVDISDPSEYETEKSFAFNIGGTAAIAAPRIKEVEVPLVEFVGEQTLKEVNMSEPKNVQRLYLVDEAELRNRFPKIKTELQKSASLSDGIDVEIYTLEIESSVDDTFQGSVDEVVEAVEEVSVATEPEQVQEFEISTETPTEVTNGESAEIGVLSEEPENVEVEEPSNKETESEVKDALYEQLLATILELKSEILQLKVKSEPKVEDSSEEVIKNLRKEIEDLNQKHQESQQRLEKIVKSFNSFVPETEPRPEVVTKRVDQNKMSPIETLSRLIPFSN